MFSRKTTRDSSSIGQSLFVQCPQRNFFGMPCGLLWEALFQTISGNIQIRTSVDRRCRLLRCRSVGKLFTNQTTLVCLNVGQVDLNGAVANATVDHTPGNVEAFRCVSSSILPSTET